jgi:hypothetical protein
MREADGALIFLNITSALYAAAEAIHQSIMTVTTEECNARGRSQTQWERGPDLYPSPNVPSEVGAHIAALSF